MLFSFSGRSVKVVLEMAEHSSDDLLRGPDAGEEQYNLDLH